MLSLLNQTVAVYLQPLTEHKPKPTVNTKNCSYVCAHYCDCAQLSYAILPIQHRTVLIIFPLTLQTVITAQILSDGRGNLLELSTCICLLTS